MSQSHETRDKIIQQSSELFNQQGYAGSSLSDIMRVTGLKKGGIYNHFKSKDEIALAAFDFAVEQVTQRYQQVLRQPGAIARLCAMIDVFGDCVENAPIPGGCPILNTAIESDDTHPALRERAQQAMNRWRSLIIQIVKKGIQQNQLKPSIDADEVASILISALEGALMMTKLYGDSVHLKRISCHLKDYITQTLAQS